MKKDTYDKLLHIPWNLLWIFSVFSFGETFALVKISLRFFVHLYATTEGFLKHCFKQMYSSTITFQCFFTIFEIEGNCGWNVVTRTVLSVPIFDTRFRPHSFQFVSHVWKYLQYFWVCSVLIKDLVWTLLTAWSASGLNGLERFCLTYFLINHHQLLLPFPAAV